MSEFLKLIRIAPHVGSSPTALRAVMREMEERLKAFGQQQEAGQKERGGSQPEIVGSGDETWFDEQPVLVLMDLVSGYLVLEEPAQDRSYETWHSKAQARLEQMGVKVRHFISDRGKALVKLATSGLGCWAGADLFHAQYDISKWLGCALHGKLNRARQQRQEAAAELAAIEKKPLGAGVDEQKHQLAQAQAQLETIEAAAQAYHEAQRAVSAVVHAFSAADNTAQTSAQVTQHMEEQAQRFAQIAEAQSVSDPKDTVGKFRRQIADVASSVDAWWLWTTESLNRSISTADRDWLLHIWLPVVYWQHQLHKTQNPEMKPVYTLALHNDQAACLTHPVTRTLSQHDWEHWLSWAEWATHNFHRASSAVEGRNGCLAQCYHNGRGLTHRRLAALTTIHNYDTRRRDGSTPAERLYGERFPNLFEWLLEQMEALPLPRAARQPALPNPLDFISVAA